MKYFVAKMDKNILHEKSVLNISLLFLIKEYSNKFSPMN